MNFWEAEKEYLLEIKVRKYTAKTQRGYRNNLDVWCRFAEEKGYAVEDFCKPTLKEFIGALDGRKGTYINSLLRTVKSLLTYCSEQGYTTYRPKNNWLWVKEEKAVVAAFEPKQIKALLNNCKGNDFLSVRDRAIITMLFETGIRCGELCDLRVEDIHEDYLLIHGKNHKQRIVPITAPLSKAMVKYSRCRESRYRYKSPEPEYFLSYRGRKLTVAAVEVIMKGYGNGVEGVRLSPHTCRHTFAQQQVKMGTDLYTISRLLGHENIGITQTYLNSLRDSDIVEMCREKSVLSSLG